MRRAISPGTAAAPSGAESASRDAAATSSATAAARRAWLRAAGLLAAPLLLAGCGFKLRGATEFPFKTLYAGFAPGSPIGVDFRRMLRTAGNVQLVDRPEAADVRLDVLHELREKEVMVFSSTGRPREYQLRLRFAFRASDAKGAEVIEPTELSLWRDITTTDAQWLAKEQEEVILYREMQADMVQQLLSRLAAVRRQVVR